MPSTSDFSTRWQSNLDGDSYAESAARSMMRLKRGMNVELTKVELKIINNALNEVCNGIDLEGEF